MHCNACTLLSKPNPDAQSAVLVPIEEGEKKDGEDGDEEEGAEEVALDWWSKYFASKVQ